MNSREKLFYDALSEIHPSVEWWKQYLYHFTDINNCVSILKEGYLFSRHDCLSKGLMKNDNANSEVISHTDDGIQDMVRLYFRPKTPTQYHNEGYKSGKNNVPVPIFLTFKSYKILGMQNVMFSEKALNKHGSSSNLKSSIEEFKTFNFKGIYSHGWYDNTANSSMKDFRHAEVVVSNSLSVDEVVNIWCRSNAEMETLKYKLKQEGILHKYENRIGVKESNDHLFYRNGSFLKDVSLVKNTINIEYSLIEEIKFKMTLTLANNEIVSERNKLDMNRNQQSFLLNESLYKKLKEEGKCIFKVHFNDVLIYENELVVDLELPF